MQVYHTLEERFARISSSEDSIGILQWDAETMMPQGAADSRSDQLATLKGIAHELLTARATSDLLDGQTRKLSWADPTVRTTRNCVRSS